MKRLTILVAVLAVAASACGGDASTSTTAEPSTDPTTPALPDGAQGDFAVVEVGMSADSQYVVLQNTGEETANLAGFALCQAPGYETLGDAEIGPSGIAVIVLGGSEPDIAAGADAVLSASIGAISNSGGEVGLYRSSFFGSADAIVSYVEWGSPDHTRSGVAVEAGIWNEGGFVETTESTTAIVARPPGTSSDDWST